MKRSAADITGLRHDRITVTGRDDRDRYGAQLWWYKCDCGAVKKATARNLINGNIKSCGCLKRELATAKNIGSITDLTDVRFGKLVVQDRAGYVNNEPAWLCRCDCGTSKIVAGSSLKKKTATSCGCTRRESARTHLVANSRKRKLIEYTAIDAIENRGVNKNNTSGVSGVSYNTKTGKYRAYITFQRRWYGLGEFADIKDAIKARRDSEERLFGEFLKRFRSRPK